MQCNIFQAINRTSIWITTRFSAQHRWLDAPEEVIFLRAYHRHCFHVYLEKEVTHNNRDIEFITLKKEVDDYLARTWQDSKTDSSCEQIAWDLLNRFQARSVVVSEDGENGASVAREVFSARGVGLSEGQINEGTTASTIEGGKYRPTTPQAPVQPRTTPGNSGLGNVRAEDNSNRGEAVTEGAPSALLPALKKRSRCFVGREAEGIWKGKYFLFVPGSTSPDEFSETWARLDEDVDGIYYGAGWDTAFRAETFSQIYKVLTSNQYVAIEVNSYEQVKCLEPQILRSPATIVISNTLEDLNQIEDCYVKTFSPGKVHILKRKTDGEVTVHTTNLDDPLYNEDKEI